MSFTNILSSSLKELSNPTEETTIELLDCVKLKKVNDNFIVKYIHEYEDDFGVFYETEKRKYFFTTYIEKEGENHYKYASIEPYYEVYLSATSKKYTRKELEELSGLNFSDGWSVGDDWNARKREFTNVKIRHISEKYYNGENSLDKLLNQLYNEKDRIELIRSITDCKIIIASWHHISNVNGLLLNKQIITALENLGLDLDYMPYVFK